jgi:hypothetical protein
MRQNITADEAKKLAGAKGMEQLNKEGDSTPIMNGDLQVELADKDGELAYYLAGNEFIIKQAIDAITQHPMVKKQAAPNKPKSMPRHRIVPI